MPKRWRNLIIFSYLLMFNLIVYALLATYWYYDPSLTQQLATATRLALPTMAPTKLPSPTATTVDVNQAATPTQSILEQVDLTPITSLQTFTPSPTRSTVTETAVPTKTATERSSPTPSPTRQPTITPSATTIPTTLPTPTPDAGSIEAIPMTNGSIALSWIPINKTARYRVYSDMGTGYGVYILKTETRHPAFLDQWLRRGLSYTYRLAHQTKAGEFTLDEVQIEW